MLKFIIPATSVFYTILIVDCGALDNPDNGMVDVSETVLDSVATYSCNTGYTLTGDAMRTCQGDGTWSGSEPICVRFGIGSGCSIITSGDVERVLSSYVPEQRCSIPSACPPIISIVDMFINCLASGPIRGTYTHTTVTVRYQRSDEPGATYIAQADIACSNLTSTWEADVLRSLATHVNQVFDFGSGTEDSNVMRSCSACLSPSLADDLSLRSDPEYHCVGRLNFTHIQ